MSKRKRIADDGLDAVKRQQTNPVDAYSVGSRVMVFGKHAAVCIRYISDQLGLIGVEMDRSVGNCDGLYHGERYFQCKPHRGLFVRIENIQVFSKKDAAACTIQAVWRRRKCLQAFRTLVLTSSWNILDNHQEQLNLKRGEQTKRASDTLLSLAEKKQPVLVRSVSSVPATYAGPTLSWPLTLPVVLNLLEAFKNNQVLHASFVLQALDNATTIFIKESTVQTINLPTPEHKLTIVGDLHGQIQDLYCIFLANGLPSPTNYYLFNGDFVDRGIYGAEVFLLIICFKLLYPSSVFLNRGNHECRNQNGWMGFEEEILFKYKSDDVKSQPSTVLERFQTCFDSLPLCAVVLNKIFVVHGGLFSKPRVTLKELQSIDRVREPPLHSTEPLDKLFEEMLWSDPRQIHGRQQSTRGAGVEFGDDVTVDFCSANRVALIIRSHECVPDGYAIQHGGRLITLFSASRYCGTQLNQGAYLTLGIDCKPEIQQFMAPPWSSYTQRSGCLFTTQHEANPTSIVHSDESSKESLEEDLLRMIAERICDHKTQLFSYFSSHDEKAHGFVSRIVWAEALKNVLKLDVPFLHYQSKLVDVDSNNMINYSKFLSRYRIENPTVDASGWQESIISTICKKLYRAMGAGSIEQAFQIFDTDSNGTIEYDEFVATLKQMDTGLSEQQMFDLMRTADTNDDGRLDFKEFVQRFEVIFTHVGTKIKDGSDSQQTIPDAPSSPQDIVVNNVDAETMVALVQIGKAFFRLEGSLLDAFERFDTNHDGVLQADEFKAALVQLDLKFSPELFDKIWHTIDLDGGNTIDYKEFLQAFTVQDKHIEKKDSLTWQQTILQQVSNVFYQHRIHIRSAFRLFDQDNSGSISRDEFRAGISTFNAILDRPLSEDQVEALLSHLDTNGDNCISYAEFLKGFQVVGS